MKANPKSLLIRGGRIIDPANAIDAKGDLLLGGGRIVAVNPSGKLRDSADETFDARDLIVAPGFVDLHVHLREPGQSHKETIATGTAAAAAGGFTSVCAMPNTTPVNDSPDITAWMQADERGALASVFPVAAATLGSLGEKLSDYKALRRAGAVAVSDDGKPVLDDDLMRNALHSAARLDMPVIQHAEDTRLTQNGVMNAGAIAFRLGLRGMPVAAESGIVERDIELARRARAHLHVAHLSTAAALEAVRRGKASGVRLTSEVTPHHFTLTDADVGDYDTCFKMNPPLRSADDCAAMVAGLRDGSIDAIATDHAPHARHEKEVEFDKAAFGVIGLETALGLAITILHRQAEIPLSRIVELFSTNPARIIGLKDRGTLAEGGIADLTIFDPKKTWIFEAARSRSKSRNTPFDGWKLTGRVAATIVGGTIVYRRD